MSIRTLRESWKDAPQAIEELEKEGEVLVTRTSKDQQMRMVFWNEIKPIEGTGGMPVEQGWSLVMYGRSVLRFWIEFKDLWHGLKVPPDADLLRALSSGKPGTSESSATRSPALQRASRSPKQKVSFPKDRPRKRKEAGNLVRASAPYGLRTSISRANWTSQKTMHLRLRNNFGSAWIAFSGLDIFMHFVVSH